MRGPRHAEVRAKIPSGVGTWSAPLWEWAYPYGAGGLEIDEVEQLGKESHAYHTTVHNWVSGNIQKGQKDVTKSFLFKGFHVYAADIEPGQIVFSFDGTPVCTVKNTDVGVVDFTTFKTVANIDLDMGGWGGPVSCVSPQKMLVDYVRVSPLT